MTERVNIEAYLRLRPGDGIGNVKVLGEREAIMSSTTEGNSAFNMPRSTSMTTLQHTATITAAHSFSHVFDEGAAQKDLYREIAAPLVADLLARARNSLLFAYGVSGSGKTHTIQGGQGEEAGLLPRVLHSVLASVRKHQSSACLRPYGLTRVEKIPSSNRLADSTLPGDVLAVAGESDTRLKSAVTEGNLAEASGLLPLSSDAGDAEFADLPSGCEYSVWCSYAEVYNEKIYDLFDTSEKRSALTLKTDRSAGSGKYVSGLREIRAFSTRDADVLLQAGQRNRQVFSTKINSSSSRSHSIFTIRVICIPAGARDSDNESLKVARLSIVDLAGAERWKNAETIGERLKEAGNINKSLLALAQCVQVLRDYQELKGQKKPAIPPFRNSKLTEMFQPFFCGDGKAVIVAAVNPYQTAYEDNQRVLRFAGIAAQITTTRAKTASSARLNQLVPCTPGFARALNRGTPRTEQSKFGKTPLNTVEEGRVTPFRSFSRQSAESLEEVDERSLEEAEGDNEFIEALLQEIRNLRYEALQKNLEHEHALAAAVRAVRDQAEADIQAMEASIQHRIEEERQYLEDKTDRKIDILQHVHAAEIQSLKDQLAKCMKSRRISAAVSDAVSDEENVAPESKQVKRAKLL